DHACDASAQGLRPAVRADRTLGVAWRGRRGRADHEDPREWCERQPAGLGTDERRDDPLRRRQGRLPPHRPSAGPGSPLFRRGKEETEGTLSRMTTTRKRVLFVCVENSCRSQIAEAFARMHGAGAVEPYSAGSKPSGKVNPNAIASERVLGYDLSRHRSKALSDIPAVEYDVAVTMGRGHACPHVPAT